MAGSPLATIRETRQCWWVRWAKSPRIWLAGVRASVVAKKRVTTVERRERRKVEEGRIEQRTKNRSECPQGLTGGGVSQAQLTWPAPKV